MIVVDNDDDDGHNDAVMPLDVLAEHDEDEELEARLDAC